jgi:acetylornithine/N-succinyldiaminopimelate aminotransferase
MTDIASDPRESGSARASFEAPVYARLPVTIAEGSGVNVRDEAGREYLDFYGGHAVAVLGYRHPRLLRVLEEQAARLFFQTNAVDLEIRRRACQRLALFAPAPLRRVFLVNSGAEANENALRLACRWTGRTQVVCLEGAFHGRTAAAGACTAGSAAWYGFPRTPFDVLRVPVDDEAALEAAIGPKTAALILEAVQGQAGARDLAPSFLQRARELTRRHGAFLIADEVQCGMGRTGTAFAIEAAGVVPDFLTTAKGVAGGFPASALLMPEELAARLAPGDLGTTFGGGPLACALITEVVDILSEPGFLEHVRAMGELIRTSCRVGPVVGVQGRGLLAGLRTSHPAAGILRELLQRGILAGGAADPYVVRLLPPLVVERAHIEALRTALAGISP